MVYFLWLLPTISKCISRPLLTLMVGRRLQLFPLIGIVRSPLRWMSFLGSFCRIGSIIKIILFKRKVIVNPKDISRITCANLIESTWDLFVMCNLAYSIWYNIFRWLRSVWLFLGILVLFSSSFELMLWTIWFVRNDTFFIASQTNDKEVEDKSIFDMELVSLPLNNSLFSDWLQKPIMCLNQQLIKRSVFL